MGGGSSSGSQSSSISYTGSPYFDKLLQVMAKDYGTNRATSDLIFGGPRYGNARNFLDQRFAKPGGLTQDQWAQQLRSLGSAEARQLATAATQNKTRDRNIYKSVKDGETTLWAFDPGQNVYVGWGIRKNSDGTSSKYRAGAWAPSLGTQAPWIASPEPDEPPPPNPPGPPSPPAPQPNPGGTEPDTGGGSPGGGPGMGGPGSGFPGGGGTGGTGGGTAPPRGGPPTSAGTGARRPPFGGAGWEQSWGSFDPNDPAPKPTNVDRPPSRQDDEYLDFFRRLMQGGA